MALTPEQVLNKHFQTTQFRRGYEERDVDDFLDEVVAEMRSLIEQRDDYLKQLNDCRASKNQTAVRGGDASGVMPAVRPGDEAKLAGLTAKIQDAERAFRVASERATKAKAEADNAERLARERVQRAEQAAQSSVDAATLNDAQARLTALPGVGLWTAAEVGRTALGDADAVSVGDYHLPDQVAWALAGEPRGDDDRMLALLAPSPGHRGRVIRLIESAAITAPRRGPRMPANDIRSL